MLPDDLMTAYQTFSLLALKHGYAYAGFMMRANPTEFIGIGNVTQNGKELATLLRRYAEIIEQKAEQGLVMSDQPKTETESIN
jgi:hypothetical protein